MQDDGPTSETETLRSLKEPREQLAGPLSALGPELFKRLESSAVAAGARINPGSKAALVFIRKGCVAIETHRERPRLLQAGSTLVTESVTGPRHGRPQFTAVSDCELLTLPTQAYLALKAAQPQLAVQLLERLLCATLESAVRLDPRRGRVVQETTQEAPASATLQIEGTPRVVAVGTPLKELLPERVDGVPVVAALVDRKATALSDRVSAACSVHALTSAHWEGRRIHRLSLALLALEAAFSLHSEVQVTIGPSVGFGRRLLLRSFQGQDLDAFAESLEARMHQLVQSNPQLREELWTQGAAREYFARGGWLAAEQLLETWQSAAVPVASYGQVYAPNPGPLLPDLTRLDGFHLLRDEDLLLLVYANRQPQPLPPIRTMPPQALSCLSENENGAQKTSTRQQMVKQARQAASDSSDANSEEHAWLRTLSITSVGSFNHACVAGSVPQLIRVAEAFQEKRLTRIADEIHDRIDELEVVCIAGPSASGKTTFIRRLCVQLQVSGINAVALGLDNFYKHRTETPKDASGDYDYESLEALDLTLLQDCLGGLLSGREMATPRYDFLSGRSHPRGGPTLRLGTRDVLLLEGIHGLNPALLESVVQRKVYRLFVCPLMQLSFDHLARVHPSDVRLIRRIVRDRHARGHSAAESIARWPKVRSGERSHIYPFQANADAVFDSALVYELSVLRVYAERYLLEVPQDHHSYTTAFRLLHLLSRFVSIYPDQVPANSILREFIGGSGFEY